MNRQKILLAIVVVLAAVGIVRFFWSDGTITVNFKDTPLSKVIAEVERQGGIDIVTNVPPETPVTLQLRQAPLILALETLAVRVDGELRPSIIAAPTRSKTREAISLFEAGTRSPDWEVSWSRGGPIAVGANPIDPRKLPVVFEAVAPNDLQAAVRQISAKSGLLIAVPKDWNPAVAAPRGPEAAAKMVRNVAEGVRGDSVEVFVIAAPDRNASNGPRTGPDDGPGRWDRGGDRSGMNPAWMAARAEATIAQLPPEERPAAQAEYDAMRAIWQEVAALPAEQRREKMGEIFSRPEVQERMEERMAARDALQSPEQRAQRYERYIKRKAAAQQAKK